MGLREVRLLPLVSLLSIASALGLLTAVPASSAEDGTSDVPSLVNLRAPRVEGTLRYGRTVRVDPGAWSAEPERFRYRWLRDGEPIAGATDASYRIRPDDVGHTIRVRVVARREGYAPGEALSPYRGTTLHRVALRRTVTYHVETRGRIRADVRAFRELVQQTYDDPRGWRGAGVAFRQVRRGGRFTVVLAAAPEVPKFSSGCSREWSCRVGRYVIVNQERWLRASPAWNAARRGLRDYRHMVVNHETGHWLGHDHQGCPRAGAPAPVMMQQSKGRGGCRFNPWPTLAELRRTR